jgi:hypothetical protein
MVLTDPMLVSLNFFHINSVQNEFQNASLVFSVLNQHGGEQSYLQLLTYLYLKKKKKFTDILDCFCVVHLICCVLDCLCSGKHVIYAVFGEI